MGNNSRLIALVLLASFWLSGLPLHHRVSAQEQPAAVSLPNKVQVALVEIEDILALASEVEDDALRSRIQSQAALALFKLDAERARQLLVMASNAISPRSRPSAHAAAAAHWVADELLSDVAMIDPALAESIVQERLAKQPEGDSTSWPKTESNIIMNLAHRLTTRDPERAARLAIQGCRLDCTQYGVSEMFGRLLHSLKVRHSKLADEMFETALSELKPHPDRLLSNVGWMAAHLFPHFQRDTSPEVTALHPVAIPYLTLVHDAIKELAEKRPEAVPSSYALRALLPYFKKHTPAMTDEISKIAERLSQLATPPSVTPPPIDDYLKRAEAAPSPVYKDYALESAAKLASHQGQFERAFAIANTISDSFKRSRLIEEIHHNAAEEALRQNDPPKVIRHAKEEPHPDRRAYLFMRAAEPFVRNREQQQQAMDILEEGWRSILGEPTSTNKVAALLRLVQSAIQAKSTKSFDMMQVAVDEINRTEFSPAWVSKKLVDLTPDGKHQTSIEMGVSTLRFDGSLGILARIDFDRALALAHGIRLKEASLLARLAVCSDALSSYSPPPTRKPRFPL